jgi:plastocyanin
MKKIFLLLAAFSVLTLQVNATKHTVLTSGTSYSPALLTVHIGDTVTISASASHPLLQVSKATWTANDDAALTGGFGPTSKSTTIIVSTRDTIYYICVAHISLGMKGRIIVGQFSGIDTPQPEPFSVTVFPNPVTSTGTVRLNSSGPNPVSVFVFSINGQLEKDLSSESSSLNGETYYLFDASTMSSGNHFIMVSDGRNKTVRKFEVIR